MRGNLTPIKSPVHIDPKGKECVTWSIYLVKISAPGGGGAKRESQLSSHAEPAQWQQQTNSGSHQGVHIVGILPALQIIEALGRQKERAW